MAKHLKQPFDWHNQASLGNYKFSTLKASCGGSTRQLRRQVVKQYGITTQEWLNVFKAKLAAQMLLKGDQVKCVSSLLGFKHVPSFSRFFSKQIGLTPRKFLRKNSQKAKEPTANGLIG